MENFLPAVIAVVSSCLLFAVPEFLRSENYNKKEEYVSCMEKKVNKVKFKNKEKILQPIPIKSESFNKSELLDYND